MTSLDMIVIVAAGVGVLGIGAICLTFLAKQDLIRKIGFYLLVIEGMALACMNAVSTPLSFPIEVAAGWILGLLSVATMIFQICGKNENRFRITRILAAASVVLGVINTFIF